MSSERSGTEQLLRDVRRLPGWDVQRARRGGHWKVYRDGRLVASVAYSPRGPRSVLNARAAIRQAGGDV